MSDLQDPVPLELTSLLQQKSDNPLLQQIFTDRQAENSSSKGLSKVTVVSKFKVLNIFTYEFLSVMSCDVADDTVLL